jgi:hypothetical protein
MVYRSRRGFRGAPRLIGIARHGVRPSGRKLPARVRLGQQGASYGAVAGPPPPASPPRLPGRSPASGRGAPVADASGAEVIDRLTRAKARPPVLTAALGVTLAGALAAGMSLGSSWNATAVFGAAAVLVLGCAHWFESDDQSAEVLYEIDGQPARAWYRVVEAFERFARCRGVWHVESRRAEGAAAGRRHRVIRRRIRARLGLPPRVKSNIRVPVLRAGRRTLYFFPERLLVYEGPLVWAVPYPELMVEATGMRVRGSDHRRDGVSLHGVLVIRHASGLNEVFQASESKTVIALTAALAVMRGQEAVAGVAAGA